MSLSESANPSSSPILIGVAGGTASGKSTLCDELIKKLGGDTNPLVRLFVDNLYRELNPEEKTKAEERGEYFDHPDALDVSLMVKIFDDITNGREVSVPIYDFHTHSRVPNVTSHIGQFKVLIVDGILALHFNEIRKHFSLELFVDTDADTRLARRIERDVNMRGRTVSQVIKQ